MTIKELFKWATENGIENTEISVVIKKNGSCRIYDTVCADKVEMKPFIKGEYKDNIIVRGLFLSCEEE